ncbi:MupG family TIM beta-alpha barrel fold protein [Spiroplasma endosymbiont of Cantharis rufa]|uniref:MupG family TIM beta-alpha barrel fold protein n=1 Tax=Spiroplasma endosymbiont of Cantharis rufa TaxID=3066279 RepID=UPI0030D5636D
MKRKLGISIYPEQSNFEKDKQYLDLAKQLNYEIVFTSILHFVGSKNDNKKAEMVLKSLKYAKEIGFYTILDVEYQSMELIGINVNDLSKCKEYGIDCLRLDSPSLPFEIANITHNKSSVDIQLNMSNNDSLIDNVIDFKPIRDRLSGCHNFYPLEYTGLPFDYFSEANKRYLKYNLSTAAFVGSHHGNMTSAVGWRELPTLEEQRNLSISEQAKILFYTNEIDAVIIGNAYATKSELEELANIDKYEITLNLKPIYKISKIEKNILEFNHFRRGDITEYFIRSTFSRVEFKNDSISSQNTKKIYNKGDVVIINNNDIKYKGECHIILKDKFDDKHQKYNWIGTIKKSEYRLLDFIGPWSHFRFRIED